MVSIRFASDEDLESILEIYNQGIEDRVATLEEDAKGTAYIQNWFSNHSGRYRVFVAEDEDKIVGWADLHPYSHRCAYSGVGVFKNHGKLDGQWVDVMWMEKVF